MENLFDNEISIDPVNWCPECGEPTEACDGFGVCSLAQTHRYENIKLSRIWVMPSIWTFSMKPVRKLFSKYGVGTGWIDPFGGGVKGVEMSYDFHKEVAGWSWYKRLWVRFRCFVKYRIPMIVYLAKREWRRRPHE
jgi:hypothetical protein